MFRSLAHNAVAVSLAVYPRLAPTPWLAQLLLHPVLRVLRSDCMQVTYEFCPVGWVNGAVAWENPKVCTRDTIRPSQCVARFLYKLVKQIAPISFKI